MSKAPFTFKSLMAMKVGDTRGDPAVPGLRARRRATGVFFEIRYKAGPGIWQSIPLGRLPSEEAVMEEAIAAGRSSINLTVDALEPFRKTARAMSRRIRDGLDPVAEPEDAAAFTLQQALHLHLEGKARSPRTVEDYKSAIAQHFGDWRNKPLAEITRTAVRERHQSITKDHGPYAANLALRVFRAVWNRARRQYPELPETPTANVDWNKEVRRDAAVPLANLPTWYEEVIALANPIRRDFYLLTAFTGLRRRTVDRIRLDHIDLAAKTLFIPEPKGGSDKAFTLPLSDFLVDLIEARIAGNADRLAKINKRRIKDGKKSLPPSPWLYPVSRGKSGHLSEPKPSGRDVFTVGFTIHGLRNTYLSAAAAAGVSPYHSKLLVNHSVPKADVTAGYISADVDALRPSQQRITDYLKAAMKVDEGQAADNVVALHA